MPATIAFINAQFRAGADIVVLADHATGNLVGPYHYEEHLLPIHQEITAQVGGPLILHVCGNCSDRLELFARSGVDGYHFEWQVDSQDAVRRIGKEISLVGNINNPQYYCKERLRMYLSRRAMRLRPGCTSSLRSVRSR